MFQSIVLMSSTFCVLKCDIAMIALGPWSHPLCTIKLIVDTYVVDSGLNMLVSLLVDWSIEARLTACLVDRLSSSLLELHVLYLSGPMQGSHSWHLNHPFKGWFRIMRKSTVAFWRALHEYLNLGR